MKLGALEAGGTKMVCAIGDEKGNILEQISIPTETPEITIPKLLSFYEGKEIEALDASGRLMSIESPIHTVILRLPLSWHGRIII